MSAYKPKNTSEEYLLKECRRLEREVADLRTEKEQKQIVARAKDARLIKRSPFLRVLRLVQSACMDLKRVAGGWLLTFGNNERKFKRLNQVWGLFIADDWVLREIFNPPPPPKRDRVLFPKPILPARHYSIAPLACAKPVTGRACAIANNRGDSSTDEKIKLIEKSAINLPESMNQSIAPFSLEQITSALDYYKATINKGKEIKSATGWLLKCLKEEWYLNFVPQAPAYSPKIFTCNDLPSVEAVPMPANFWDQAKNNLNGLVSDRTSERLDNLIVPF